MFAIRHGLGDNEERAIQKRCAVEFFGGIMCLACLEYIKGNLKLSEFKSAIREFTQDETTKNHAEELQTIIYDHDGNEDTLKDKIKTMSSGSSKK